MKYIKLKLFRNLAFGHKLKYLCCGLHNQIIKNSGSRRATFYVPSKTTLFDWTALKFFFFHHAIFPKQDR